MYFNLPHCVLIGILQYLHHEIVRNLNIYKSLYNKSKTNVIYKDVLFLIGYKLFLMVHKLCGNSKTYSCQAFLIFESE